MARICLIREWYFPVDARVSREVQALIRAGHEVDVICASMPGQPRVERNGALTVYRLPIARRRAGLWRYLFEFVAFQIAATLMAAALQSRRGYDIVQVHSLPDWLVFAAIVPRVFGARVLLDLHECMPEYFTTKYGLASDHIVARLLMFLEQASIRFADSVITCTEQMRERFIERGADGAKIAVILNSFDEERFDPRRYPRSRNGSDPFVLVCHGTIDENYGLDVAIRAVALLRDRIPRLRLEIYGNGTHRASVQALARELDLGDSVWFSDGFVPIEELLPRIADADVGVVAIRRDTFRDLTHCNKMYDLVAMRKPVVISRTTAVRAYFGDDCFQMFDSGNERDLARAIHGLYADPELRERLVRRASEVAEPYRWVHQREHYVDVVRRLLATRRRVPKPAAVEGSGVSEPIAVEAGERS
jgi:glycosyltransferase involved in cell wall biosynthesis